ncbi:hypothetical protein B0T24DRAFT_587253 [Lasiosphaeria ovina]|uniref:Secreted protein n=1 Tax=Lasiosphaeria ovina TaxID=92902 RepID=A0AAE0NJ64_9PEZI|nr:hypothetical protein B0T24DRAFT_587253 [Lasiosphaeria ovina]
MQHLWIFCLLPVSTFSKVKGFHARHPVVSVPEPICTGLVCLCSDHHPSSAERSSPRNPLTSRPSAGHLSTIPRVMWFHAASAATDWLAASHQSGRSQSRGHQGRGRGWQQPGSSWRGRTEASELRVTGQDAQGLVAPAQWHDRNTAQDGDGGPASITSSALLFATLGAQPP